jgi:hypothetical protein
MKKIVAGVVIKWFVVEPYSTQQCHIVPPKN